uniref:HYR domain-containing protein n=1 Tax=Chromera velia CCMP2878 TaxID=1169474 RepID=A0A0G4HT86_9ALVE|eukprot:Cvel_8408.t1-p1 / transcript=Cvel_8408.t1 / gene=Cvel_8408 / organism=Chromera_velia_CCMP2878 / gene_product=Fibrillin-1, putative / transcript_product=Fibrillin-1, putative / location=Cvel_scaffold464:40137-49736(-) / protein_length=709 / sequence_SO=supercontig / SO=protein_coding / is_pseudo=false
MGIVAGLPNGTECTNIDEYAMSVNDCDPIAACNDTFGSFFCICGPGLFGPGTFCADSNECQVELDNCATQPEATCNNTVGSFVCTCPQGYGTSDNGVTCTDANECSSSTHNCDIHASCTNTDGSFYCTCNTGYGGSGIFCIESLHVPCGSSTAFRRTVVNGVLPDVCLFQTSSQASVLRLNMPNPFLDTGISVSNLANDTCRGTVSDDGAGCASNNLASTINLQGLPGEFYNIRAAGTGGTVQVDVSVDCVYQMNFTLGSDDICDHNECAQAIHTCSIRFNHTSGGVESTAACTDTVGSFQCACLLGFEDRIGDGSFCDAVLCANQPTIASPGWLQFTNPTIMATTGAEATFKCPSGFSANTGGGPATVKCEGVIQLTAAFPASSASCPSVKCSGVAPIVPVGGTMTPSSPPNGFWQPLNSVTFTCNDGYLEAGSQTVMCSGVDGADPPQAIWQDDSATSGCEAIACSGEAPTAPTYGTMSPSSPPNGDGWVTGDSVTFACPSPLVLVGDTGKTCSAVPLKKEARWNDYTITPKCKDKEVPTILCPRDIDRKQVLQDLLPVTYPTNPIVFDNVDNPKSVSLSYSTPSGSGFKPGQTTVTMTATDSSGNSASCTFVVRVEACPYGSQRVAENAPCICRAGFWKDLRGIAFEERQRMNRTKTFPVYNDCIQNSQSPQDSTHPSACACSEKFYFVPPDNAEERPDSIEEYSF